VRYHLLRLRLRFLELLNIRSKLRSLLHDTAILRSNFVVHIHAEDLLSEVKESLAKDVSISKQCATQARRSNSFNFITRWCRFR